MMDAVALGGAWWNRSGEAESRLDLSERELKMPFSGFDRESSGLAFALAWRVGVAAEAGEANLDWDENRSARWLDRAKMESLGFDLSDVSEYPRLGRHELARDVLLVLEFDGMAYRRALERARQHPEVGAIVARMPFAVGYSITVMRRISACCTTLSRGTKWIICVPSLAASASISSSSRSVFRLLQIKPARRTPPELAYLTMPLQMLLAAYMAIISPEQTM